MYAERQRDFVPIQRRSRSPDSRRRRSLHLWPAPERHEEVTDSIARLLGVDHENSTDSPSPAGGWCGRLPILCRTSTVSHAPNRPLATGLLSGLRSGVTAKQLARAAFEGVACRRSRRLDALRALVPGHHRADPARRWGSRVGCLRQIVADLIGQEITVADADQAVATGTAARALEKTTTTDRDRDPLGTGQQESGRARSGVRPRRRDACGPARRWRDLAAAERSTSRNSRSRLTSRSRQSGGDDWHSRGPSRLRGDEGRIFGSSSTGVRRRHPVT